jgi:cytochrome c553
VSRRKKLALAVAVLVAVAGLGGFLVAASGIIPIDASSGHWAITKAFLQFSKKRSVSMHSRGLDVPPLERPSLVARGAAHFEIGCRSCHGSPEQRAPRVAQKMLPVPPDLAVTSPKWRPEQLFYMVKHGIKLTGMPAWPSAKRDDEVWAMVAFLRVLPQLDAAGYRRLGSVTAERPPAPLDRCARCHGVDGRGGDTGAFPVLAGQRPEYLTASLEAYAKGARHSGTMESVAAELTPAQIRELAAHYARLPAAPRPGARTARGESIAQRGIPERDVPACAACHGPGATRRNPIFPVLAGQHAEYLALQLTLFQKEERGGTSYAHLMRSAAAALTPEEIRDVAAYYAALAP